MFVRYAMPMYGIMWLETYCKWDTIETVIYGET